MSAEVERLFWRLLLTADDYGAFDADPEVVMRTCFQRATPGVTAESVPAWIDSGAAAGLWELRLHGADVIGYMSSWKQRVRANASKFPPRNAGQMTGTCLTDDRRGSRIEGSVEDRGSREEKAHAPKTGALFVRSGDETPGPVEAVNATAHEPRPVERADRHPVFSTQEQFRQFYRAYPVHIAPDRAERAFRAALKRGATPELMLAAIERQKREREVLEQAGQFAPAWKHPSAWLNGGCWKDGPLVALPPPPPTPEQVAARKDAERAAWLRHMQQIRAQSRQSFERLVRGWPPERLAALERELDALPTPERKEVTDGDEHDRQSAPRPAPAG